jgi:hypothetical protein
MAAEAPAERPPPLVEGVALRETQTVAAMAAGVPTPSALTLRSSLFSSSSSDSTERAAAALSSSSSASQRSLFQSSVSSQSSIFDSSSSKQDALLRGSHAEALSAKTFHLSKMDDSSQPTSEGVGPSTPATQKLPHTGENNVKAEKERASTAMEHHTRLPSSPNLDSGLVGVPPQRLLSSAEDLDTVSTLPTSMLNERTASANAPSPPLTALDAVPSCATDPPTGLTATLGETYGCPSLSQLASGLLFSEALDACGLPLVKPCINAAELSWAAKPLHSAQAKKIKKKATLECKMDSATAPATVSESAAPPLSSSKATRLEKASSKKRAATPTTTKTTTTAPTGGEASGAKASQRKKHKAETGGATTLNAPPESEGTVRVDATPPAPPLTRSDEAERGPHTSLQPVEYDLGDFDVEDCPFPDSAAHPLGSGSVSHLSELSFLVSGEVAPGNEAAQAPPLRKRKREQRPRKPPAKDADALLLQSEQHNTAAAQSPGDSPPPASEACAAEMVTATLLPQCVYESDTDDELLIDKVWVREGTSTDDAPPLPPAAPADTQAKKRKRAPRDSTAPRGGAALNRSATTSPLEKSPNPLAWWAATQAAVASNNAPVGRPCMWVELSAMFQETHAGLLRQLLVYWGCAHQSKETTPGKRGNVRVPAAAVSSPLSSQKSSTPRGWWRRLCANLPPGIEVSSSISSTSFPSSPSAGDDGVVMLLCPPSVSVTDALQWWTQRAHVAHGYMPPLLAVSMTAEAATTTPTLTTSPSVGLSPSQFSADSLLLRAVLHASCSVQMDPKRSLAVSCTETGTAAFAQILPRSQIYTSLDACASMLSTALDFPSTEQRRDTATGALQGDEVVDVGSLAAVVATTALHSPPDSHCGRANAGHGKTHLSVTVQDRCFAELCKWNGLAARLRDNPRRPQLLLHRVCVGELPGAATQRGNSDASGAAPKTVFPSSDSPPKNRASPSLLLWASYGLVRPATCNSETFANTARREARLLASHAPPVTLLPAHTCAFSLFASVLFKRDNFVTAVNVIDAHARASQRCLANYVSGYSCVVTGPMRYAVSATVRRYLHVRLSVNATPLLALVSRAASKPNNVAASGEGGRAGQKKAAKKHAAAPRSPSSLVESAALSPDVIQAVSHLAQEQWRSVIDSLSCNCRPGVCERVAHTPDGTKVCRHLAELFYFFVTQQFRVVPGGRQDVSWMFSEAVRGPARHVERGTEDDTLPACAPVKEVDKRVTLEARGLRSRSTASQPEGSAVSRSHSSSYSRSSEPMNTSSSPEEEADMLLNNVPLSVLYHHSASLFTSNEGSETADSRTPHKSVGSAKSAPAQTEDKPEPLLVAPDTRSTHHRKKTKESKILSAAPSTVAESSSIPTLHSPPPSSLLSPETTSFHTEALQYVLQYISQRRAAGEGGAEPHLGSFNANTASSGTIPTAQGSATSSAKKKDHKEERLKSSEEDEARALQVLEQLLRNALH